MDEQDWAARNDLADPIAQVDVGDCRVTFRRQRGTGDVWYLASGPLGTIAVQLISSDILERVRRSPIKTDPLARRARNRYASWHHTKIDDDFLVAVRARGSSLEWGYMFGDGVPFGGGGSGLPTARRPSLLERVQMWISGRRVGYEISVLDTENDARS